MTKEQPIKIEFETFNQIESYAVRNLKSDQPYVWNSRVDFRRYKVTIEMIDEPQEVLAARLQEMWETSDNSHHSQPLREAAASIGYTFVGSRGSKAKIEPGLGLRIK